MVVVEETRLLDPESFLFTSNLCGYAHENLLVIIDYFETRNFWAKSQAKNLAKLKKKISMKMDIVENYEIWAKFSFVLLHKERVSN